VVRPTATEKETEPTALRNWSTFQRYSRSQKGMREHLIGEVFGSAKHPDGTRIVTSAIVFRDATWAVTASGHRYRLEGSNSAAPAVSMAAELDGTCVGRIAS
jgi:hypothetical protein